MRIPQRKRADLWPGLLHDPEDMPLRKDEGSPRARGDDEPIRDRVLAPRVPDAIVEGRIELAPWLLLRQVLADRHHAVFLSDPGPG